LSDDPVAEVVQRALEFSVYTSELAITDYASATKQPLSTEQKVGQADFSEGKIAGAAAGYYRFGSVALNQEVNLERGRAGEQVGRFLWRALNVDDRQGVPTDFLVCCGRL